MNWVGTLLLVIALITTQALVSAQDVEDIETSTTIDDVSANKPSTEENQILLDSKLRSALLQALSEIENEEDDEQTISKAQASAVTIIKDADDKKSIVTSEDTSELIQTNDITPTTTPASSTQKATQILFQKSEAIQSKSITSLEKTPLDAFKDAEQIITSASNSFLTSNKDDSIQHNEQTETRSVPNKELVLHNEQNSFQANTKNSNFPTFNTISNNESKKPPKVVVEKFSFGKAVDSPFFSRTSSKPSTSSKVSNGNVNNIKTSANNFGNNKVEKEVKVGTSTQSSPEISTEENEAKVEQVQFFSAPLVAAFTVHQDEAGQPKKVEPIYKNGLGTKKEKVATVQQQQQPIFAPQPTQTLLQSSSFNALNLQQKQQILQQELDKLRDQQQNLQSRHNFGNVQSFNSVESNNIGFTQNGFRQAINQNFNHLNPVFTEPDRSVVTKLATIDPSNILSQNSDLFFNRFTANEAIVPRDNIPLQNNNFNQIPQAKKPIQTSNSQHEVSVVPSIILDPLSDAGKLPKNAQILPNKEPTGFNAIPKVNQQQNFNFANQQFSQSLPNKESTGFNKQTQQTVLQSNLNRFARPQQPIQNPVQTNVLHPSFLQNNNFNNNNNNQFVNQNRFLRKEQGTGNFGLNHQNTFSIVPSQQPYQPKLELTYFPDNGNRLLRHNEAVLAQPQQNFVSQNSQSPRFQGFNNFNTQNTQSNGNRFFRSNLEGTLQSPQNINVQQSVQPFNNIPQSTRYYRSNQEATLNSPQNFGFNSQAQNIRILRSNQENAYLSNQNAYYQTPLLQNYRYSQSFGIPTH